MHISVGPLFQFDFRVCRTSFANVLWSTQSQEVFLHAYSVMIVSRCFFSLLPVTPVFCTIYLCMHVFVPCFPTKAILTTHYSLDFTFFCPLFTFPSACISVSLFYVWGSLSSLLYFFFFFITSSIFLF
jgi:hypothetical protein